MIEGNGALQVIGGGDIPMAHMSVQDLVNQKNFIQEIARKVMTKGKHYGTIPGCGDTLVLYKSGAEILSTTFQMSPEFDVKINDLGNGHRDYQVKCILTSRMTGKLIASGVGSCSTMESKYRYRNAQRTCPECGKTAIIKGKKEYGGGWLCFAKKDGCGTKFADSDPAITDQVVGKVDNTDIADLYNTCLKMAKKRAFVDANITATSTSDIFLQDLEEDAEEEAESPKAKAPNPKPPVATKVDPGTAIEPEPAPDTKTYVSVNVAPSPAIVKGLKDRPAPATIAREESGDMGHGTAMLVSAKENKTEKGTIWYSITDDKEGYYTTFDKAHYDIAMELINLDVPAFLNWKVVTGKKGTKNEMKLFKNLLDIRQAFEPEGV